MNYVFTFIRNTNIARHNRNALNALVHLPLDWRASGFSHDFCRAGAFLQRHHPTLARRATECRCKPKPTETRHPPTPNATIPFFTPPIVRHYGPTTKRQCADTCQTGCNRTTNSTRKNQHHHWNARTRRRDQHARAQKLQT